MKSFKAFTLSILYILFIFVCIKWIEFLGNYIGGSNEINTSAVVNLTLDNEEEGHNNAAKKTNVKNISFKLKMLPCNTIEIRFSESYAEYDTIVIPDVVHINGIEMRVTHIGEEAFKGCHKLKKIVLPSNLTYIDQLAFSGCSELSNITLPSSLLHIGEHAFSYCNKLMFLELPYGLITIERHAFSNCIGLTRITVPPTVTYVGSKAFESCTNLSVIVENKKENANHELDAFEDCKSVLYRSMFETNPNNSN